MKEDLKLIDLLNVTFSNLFMILKEGKIFFSVFNVNTNKSNKLAKHIVMHCFRAYRGSWGEGGR